MSPKPLAEALYEGSTRPDIQKVATLRSILGLFDFGPEVIEGAYGNTALDKRAYLTVNIAPERIYIVNSDSQLTNVANGSVTTYEMLAQNVDDLYPASNNNNNNGDKVTFD